METNNQAKIILSKLKLHQKLSLLTGNGSWLTHAYPKKGLKEVRMSDGPYGLRKTTTGTDLATSYPSTCFPPACLTACSFDVNLLEEMGNAIAKEAIDQHVNVVLGPGVNIKRSPLCGRNFEYFSEDPLLSGKLAAGFIKGVQKNGIGTSIKHFAVNNQESNRMSMNVVVDERALNEIYLKAFEIAIKESSPWTVMCSYNKINGKYASNNKYLLTEKLRDEWNYDGLVVSDWGATSDPSLCIKHGLDLMMPQIKGVEKYIKEDLHNGRIKIQDIDRACLRVIELALKSRDFKEEEMHHKEIYEKNYEVARHIAEESMVLLRNEDNILPLKKKEKMTVIGPFAKNPRYRSLGSSQINTYMSKNFLQVLDSNEVEYSYFDGYDLESNETNTNLENEVIENITENEKVILFIGLPEKKESEGYDRKDMKLPDNQINLVERLKEKTSNIIIVLEVGSPVELPFKSDVKAILLAYLGGEAASEAIFNILVGEVNPSGKLAETFPTHLSDNPSYYHFPGNRKEVEYRESIFIGYRFYERSRIVPAYTFGYGLSYSKFEYSDLRITSTISPRGGRAKVMFKIKNLSNIKAKEIVQIYVERQDESIVFRPKRELKAFEKVVLEPKEEKEITMYLNKDAFDIYDLVDKEFKAEDGLYKIHVSSSLTDSRLNDVLDIKTGDKIHPQKVYMYYNLIEKRNFFPYRGYEEFFGHHNPYVMPKTFSLDSTIEDIEFTFIGKILLHFANKIISNMKKSDEMNANLFEASFRESPIRGVTLIGLSYSKAVAIVDMANKHFFRGLLKFIFSR